MKRGVVLLLVSIAAWFVTLGMVSARPRGPEDATRANPAPPRTTPSDHR